VVWSLENTYWHYVQANDLEHYRTLWDSAFLGWPLSDPEPVRKERITDWIARHTDVGETLQSFDLERLTAQSTGRHVTVAYRIRMNGVTRDGTSKPSALRVIHTWRREAAGKWQIISGMSASPDSLGH
jgi:ketosteroid isomerase-like protein